MRSAPHDLPATATTRPAARRRAATAAPAGVGEWTSQALVHLVVVLMALAWVLPTLGLLVSSLRPAPDVARTGWWTVFANPFDLTRWTLANYRHVLGQQGLAQAFLNSFIITVPATVLPILVASFAAFAFAWLDFPGRSWLFLVVVGFLVVPLQMTFVPILKIYSETGLAGTFVGIWLAHTGYGLPFAVYLMRNFFGSLPGELFESAYIDGASPLSAFFRLALPMSTPALASLAIFQFLWVWNDLLVALIYLGGGARTGPLTLKLSSLVGSYGQEWHVLTAAAFISMLVPVALFFALQRYFVRGILAGAVKG
ncbi:carbohydrate ABC transporter permease [Carboxydochorda subterranea]|uniref:Carbohydrate ABC transporter permease n=2 Tax=Carboxydichorda subterranea TaxID=3109565 RepID=A0ABZ1BVC9_9FIRM|nr:carbohydrate ABC transporter permease [Limnochorda sp. L945t]WRP16749.1 carbohydrate ABC transporter permease [Limnochorda sp. L945t]